MFDKDMQPIRGKHAVYWKALSQIPGNASEISTNFKVFENYIYVYMLAPLIGLMHGRKGVIDVGEFPKETAAMLADVQIKNSAKLKYIYRLIILNDDSEGMSDDVKVQRAFRETEDSEAAISGMKLYTDYFLGGLEVLYETFVLSCATDDDYLKRIYDFVSAFKAEQEIDSTELDIEALLNR